MVLAYPDASEFLDSLPAGGDPLGEVDVQVILTRWINSLEFQPAKIPDSVEEERIAALAEEVVRIGVLADSEAEQLRKSGRTVPVEVYTRISGARALRKEYNDLRTTEADEIEAPVVYVEAVPW